MAIDGPTGAAPGGGIIDDDVVLLEGTSVVTPPATPSTGDAFTSVARVAPTPPEGPWLSATAYTRESGPTVEDDLDKIQARLHDDGVLWTRTELLRLYNDGYRQLLALSGAVRRWRPTDLPGRHTFGITQEWESGSAYRGTIRKPTHSLMAEAYQGMSPWESEAIEGLTPTTALEGHSQEWERAYLSGDSDLHFRFSFPRNHERVVRLEWQNRKLHPVGVRELDDSDSRWFAQIGEPRWWTTGTGRVRSVELYEVSSTYHQAYDLPERAEGIARTFSGSRTWAVDVPHENPTSYAYTSSADVTPPAISSPLHGLGSRVTLTAVSGVGPIHQWEQDFLNGETALTDSATMGTYTWEHYDGGAERFLLAVGQARTITSSDRQYLPIMSDTTLGALLGRIVDWRSSEDSVFALEVVIPDSDLVEDDTPTLIPPQLMKYIRYFVLSRCFGRPGEGRQPILADFYGRRFQRGVDLFRAFGNVARADRVYQRQLAEPARSRPPYVRLPAEFPNVWA